MTSNSKIKWKSIAFGLILSFYAVNFFYYLPNQTSLLYGGDQWGYYAYLPAVFVHHDLCDLTKTYNARARIINRTEITDISELGNAEVNTAPNGNGVIKYTSGVAISYAPFFGIAYIWAKLIGVAENNYSKPFLVCISISTLVFSLAGLWLVWGSLSQYFSQKITAITVLTIAFATNLFCFSVAHLAMSHTYLFFYYAVVIYSCIQFYKNPRWKHAVLIGLGCGMISLIRPSEIIVIIIPLFFGLGLFRNAKEQVFFFWQQRNHLLIAVLTAFLIGSIQLIYWKICSGHWLYDSYPGEHFNFKRPHLISGLFHFSNGWLAYTPVMYLAIFGFFFLRKIPLFFSAIIFTALHIYIIYSWWCPSYVNGFGSRPMIETYAILAFPLASGINALSKSKILGLLLALFISSCTLVNVTQTWQFKEGILWSEAANFAFIKQTLGKKQLSAEDLIVYDTGEPQPEESSLVCTVVDTPMDYKTEEKNYLELTKEMAFSPEIKIPATDIDSFQYLRINGRFLAPQKAVDIYRMSMLVTQIKRKNKNLKWNAVRIENKLNPKEPSYWAGETEVWDDITYYFKLPSQLTKDDSLKVFVWNSQGLPIRIDYLKLEKCRFAH